MHKQLLLLFFLLFSAVHTIALESTAKVDIADSIPAVISINPEVTFSELVVRVDIEDLNGYEDITDAMIIIFPGEKSELVLEQGKGTKASYIYRKSLSEIDLSIRYKITIFVSDNTNTAERSIDYEFSSGNSITGAFVQGPGSGTNIYSLIKSFFSSILSIFS